MRAIVISRHGGPEVLELRDEPEPEAGPGQLLVQLEAAGVNYRDVYEREGGSAHAAPTPSICGVEGAGTVVGSGERVAWVAAPGSYAERVVVEADQAVPLPDGAPSEEAAAVLLQGMTAHYLCHDTYPVSEGDDVLVHAAAGGVGLLLVQMVKRRGGRVIATCSPEKAELARGAGADEVIGYDGFPERVRELTGGEGVHVVYDAIGRTTFDDSLDSLRRHGYMVLYGEASGRPDPVPPERLRGKSLYLTRPGLPSYIVTRQALLARAEAVLGWVADGTLDVRVGARYPLAEARRAHEDLEARRTTGKLLLIP